MKNIKKQSRFKWIFIFPAGQHITVDKQKFSIEQSMGKLLFIEHWCFYQSNNVQLFGTRISSRYFGHIMLCFFVDKLLKFTYKNETISREPKLESDTEFLYRRFFIFHCSIHSKPDASVLFSILWILLKRKFKTEKLWKLAVKFYWKWLINNAYNYGFNCEKIFLRIHFLRS